MLQSHQVRRKNKKSRKSFPILGNWQKQGILIRLLHEGDSMLNDRISLSPEEIYEKEFKVDARGYRPQEVDNFLDLVIKDYTEFLRIIKGMEKELGALTKENSSLKQQIRGLQTELETKEDSGNDGVNNIDLLRRISQLEKFVYGKFNNN